jgi:hypothetical protein
MPKVRRVQVSFYSMVSPLSSLVRSFCLMLEPRRSMLDLSCVLAYAAIFKSLSVFVYSKEKLCGFSNYQKSGIFCKLYRYDTKH